MATRGDEECIEVRLKASDIDRISAAFEVDVVTPETLRRPYAIPVHVQRAVGYTRDFERLLEKGNVRAIDHGEFQQCVDKLITIRDECDEGANRREVLCLQRCRRGGKTFMATAVASQLENHFKGNDHAPFVILISMNNRSKVAGTETAMNAILSRIAYELDRDQAGKRPSFYEFLKKYSSFDAVIEWVENNEIILLIDELNIIEPSRAEYDPMSLFLDALVGREGSALLYTTHHRLEQDLCQGREGEDDTGHLSSRPHCWQPMPRIETEACIRHMKRTHQFWSAVLRGRIPALLALEQQFIHDFMPGNQQDDATRHLMFNAILDGNIEHLEAGRKKFRAYAYLLRNDDGKNIHVWPPFLCAQESVLGEKCPNLRAVLEAPDTNPSKAFEALAELAVAIQLMSTKPRYRDIIPRHSGVSLDNPIAPIASTAVFEIPAEAQTIDALRNAVDDLLEKDRELFTNVLQIVVIPLFSEFPIYDFFLLHRHRNLFGSWKKCTVAAGYQCKQGTKYPDRAHRAVRGVKKSIWIEGRAPTSRRGADRHGWTLLSREEHRRLLGESLYAALPSDPKDGVCGYCGID